MLYCKKCKAVCDDGLQKCPNCKSGSALRQAHPEDEVWLHRADQHTAQVLADDLADVGIACTVAPFAAGRVSYLYDSDVMPTDKVLYVPYAKLDQAKAVSAKLKERLEDQEEEAETFEEMPRRKRLFVQVISLLLFLGVIVAVVLLSDQLAAWLVGLFGGTG